MSARHYIREDEFRVWLPDVTFTKSEADGEDEAHNSRQLSGIMSTNATDRQGEVVLAKGLDFEDFINNGHFNDNHSQSTSAIIGYPESATYHKNLGEISAELVGREGWTCKGYVIKDTKRSDDIWELAKALQGTPDRRLGFSIEGKILRRSDKTIEKAKIRNVAITNCPVNTDCTWEVVAKSFTDANCAIKALAAGAATSPGAQQGGGALRAESLDSKLKKKKEALKRALEFDDLVKAMDFVLELRPDFDEEAAAHLVQHLYKNGGML
jgi:hypothetical protein